MPVNSYPDILKQIEHVYRHEIMDILNSSPEGVRTALTLLDQLHPESPQRKKTNNWVIAYAVQMALQQRQEMASTQLYHQHQLAKQRGHQRLRNTGGDITEPAQVKKSRNEKDARSPERSNAALATDLTSLNAKLMLVSTSQENLIRSEPFTNLAKEIEKTLRSASADAMRTIESYVRAALPEAEKDRWEKTFHERVNQSTAETLVRMESADLQTLRNTNRDPRCEAIAAKCLSNATNLALSGFIADKQFIKDYSQSLTPNMNLLVEYLRSTVNSNQFATYRSAYQDFSNFLQTGPLVEQQTLNHSGLPVVQVVPRPQSSKASLVEEESHSLSPKRSTPQGPKR